MINLDFDKIEKYRQSLFKEMIKDYTDIGDISKEVYETIFNTGFFACMSMICYNNKFQK